MQVITGEVSRVRRTVEAWANQNAAGTNHIVTCRIDGRAVELCMGGAPQVEEGDLLTVAGDVRRGTLHARAYKNHDTGTHDRWGGGVFGALVLLVVAGGFFLIGLAMMAGICGGYEGMAFPLLLVAASAVGFIAMLVGRVVSAARTGHAHRLVRRA